MMSNIGELGSKIRIFVSFWSRYAAQIFRYLLVDCRPLILWIMSFVIPILLVVVFGKYEPFIKWFAMFLQLAGFSITVSQFLGLHKQFKLPSLQEYLSGIIVNFPRPNRIVSAVGSAIGVGTVLSASATLRAGRLLGSDSNQNFTIVLNALDAIEKDLDALRSKIDQDNAKSKLALAELGDQFNAEILGVRSEFKAALVGEDTTIQWLGLVFVLLGTIFSSLSVEISCWLN